MRLLFTSIALLALLTGTGPRLEAKPPRPSTFSDDQIRAVLRDKVDRDRRSVGVIVGVVDENGSRVLSHGKCCTDRSGRIDGDTVFEIGSLTKPFTQALLADMVSRGEVSLGDPISRFLPTGVRSPGYKGEEITLRHLVEHTSGLPRVPDDYPSQGRDYPIEKLYAFLNRYTLPRAPGAQRAYSNMGYGLLAHLLSRRLGSSYEALIQTRIARPLGMARTFALTAPRIRGLRIAQGHDADLNPLPPDRLSPSDEGAGGLRSTMNDMIRFLSASMGLGGKPVPSWGRIQDVRGKPLILQDGSTFGFSSYMAWDPARRRGVVVLSNSNYVLSDVALHLLQPAVPLIPRRVRTSLPKALLERYAGTYGSGADALNLFRYRDRLFLERPNQPVREVFAERPERLFIDDARPIIVESDGDAPSLRLYQLDGSSVSAIRTGIASPRFEELDPSAFANFEGEYLISPGVSISVTRSGSALFAKITNQSALEVVPVGPSRVRYLAVPAEIEFIRGPNGRASSLVIHEGAETTPASRVE